MSLNLTNLAFSIKRDQLTPYKDLLKNINLLESEIKDLTNNDLKDKVKKIELEVETDKKTILSKKNLCQIFAITREVSKRSIGLRPFDTQILGGLVLNDGFIIEMKTGEGKTLVATLPTVAQSLYKQGTHVVTVNEYLAKRDCEWMGKIYSSVGINAGLIQSKMNYKQKRENYGKDITYVTNSELGFDYLRDNLANNQEELVLRNLNYCIVDEVDSILIDEARTPLIISSEAKVNTEKYFFAAEAIKYVVEGIDYITNEKTKNIFLTEKGIKKFEKILGIKDLFNIGHGWLAFVLNALRAKKFYMKNVDYIVQKDEILIVDEFTGRIMPGRRWSEGLHQSIEAKEKITVKRTSLSVASITYQNFFLLYKNFGGMTGTAKSSEIEFLNIYNKKVYEIPTAKPIIREDFPDLIFSDEINKWKAITNECAEMYQKGRPVLVGTTNIESSELLSQLLKSYKIKHTVLNAKPENAEKESEIVAKAGCYRAVTIATNMAGRGTDILLGGNPKIFASERIEKHLTLLSKIFLQRINDNGSSLNLRLTEAISYKDSFAIIKLYLKQQTILNYFNRLYNFKLNKIQSDCEQQAETIRFLGGLYVIGTDRHDSRRIDDQLRGRSGRQGDPGTSRFFLSLSDKLLRLFGGERISSVLQNIDPMDQTPLSFDFLSKALDNAQQRIENYNYGIRKDLFQYDRVLDFHRKLVYKERQKVLANRLCTKILLDYFDFLVSNYYSKYITENGMSQQNMKAKLRVFFDLLGEILWVNLRPFVPKLLKLEPIEIKKFAYDQAWLSYDLKQLEMEVYDEGLITLIERYCILQAIDQAWKKHLQIMANLRDSSNIAAFAQTQPIFEYRKVSSQRFYSALENLRIKAISNYMFAEYVYKRLEIKKN